MKIGIFRYSGRYKFGFLFLYWGKNSGVRYKPSFELWFGSITVIFDERRSYEPFFQCYLGEGE